MNEKILNQSEVNELIFREFVKNGYAQEEDVRLWDIAERRLLYLTPEQSDSFLELYNLDIYKKQIIERELNLLKRQAKKIAEELGEEPFNLIDIFCGNGTRAVEFLRILGIKNKIRYCPVNVNSYLADKAMNSVSNAGFENVVEFKPMIGHGDGRTLRYLDSNLKSGEFNRNVILLFGTILASYDINEYLFEMNKDMSRRDFLIIGNGIRSGKRLVGIEKYKCDVLKNWNIQIAKGLGLSEDEIEYDARFGNKRIEMFYRLKVDKEIEHDERKIKFKKGDEILVMVLYKYFEGEFDKFCRMYFSKVDISIDEDKGYALVVCRK